jgi:hypothetical protein
VSEPPPSYRRLFFLLLILPILLSPLSYWGNQQGLWDGAYSVRIFAIGIALVPLLLDLMYVSEKFGAWFQKQASPLEPHDSKGDEK